MDVHDCYDKGLLKKGIPDMEISRKSISIALKKLKRAKKLIKLKVYEETITNSYSAMFHASRALLFKDGVREKSHYGLFLYIKENYSDKLEKRFINELNALRMERHEINYGLDEPEIEEEDARHAVKTAEDFLGTINKMICGVGSR